MNQAEDFLRRFDLQHLSHLRNDRADISVIIPGEVADFFPKGGGAENRQQPFCGVRLQKILSDYEIEALLQQRNEVQPVDLAGDALGPDEAIAAAMVRCERISRS